MNIPHKQSDSTNFIDDVSILADVTRRLSLALLLFTLLFFYFLIVELFNQPDFIETKVKQEITREIFHRITREKIFQDFSLRNCTYI